MTEETDKPTWTERAEEARKTPGRDDLPVKANGRKYNISYEYRPEYCDLLLDMMKEGATYYQVAAKIGVSYGTMLKWSKEQPEFGEAYAMGGDWARGYYDKKGNEHLVIEEEFRGTKVKFDTGLYKFMMGSRFNAHEQQKINVVIADKDDLDRAIALTEEIANKTI